MKEVLQSTTFGSRVLFINLDSKPESCVKSFTFKYSTPLSDPIVVSYDGTKCENCTLIEGGIIANFIVPKFNTGRLSVHRSMILIDSRGMERQVTELKPLDVMIVQSYTRPQLVSGSVVTCLSDDGFMIAEAVELDIKEGPVGPALEVDYSEVSQPKIIPGMFAYNAQGERKQVYAQTLKTKTALTGDFTHLPLTTTNWGVVVGAFGTAYFNGVSVPIGMSSVIMSGGGSNATRIWGISHKVSLWSTNNTIPNDTEFIITLQYTT